MEEIMNKLKPCPFCGGEAEIAGVEKYLDSFAKEPYSVICKCGCAFLHIASDEKDAIDIWNRRAESEAYELDGFEVMNADGTPVDYRVLGLKYEDELYDYDFDGFFLREDGSLKLIDDCGGMLWVDRSEYKIIPRYKSKKK